jgi:hypothetical protein
VNGARPRGVDLVADLKGAAVDVASEVRRPRTSSFAAVVLFTIVSALLKYEEPRS